MTATILHNPRCLKSREALRMLEEAGHEVRVVEYLKTPPTAAELRRLYARAGMTPRDGLRATEPEAAALRDADDTALIDAMVANPVLIERPLVETDKGVVLARPAERVLTIV